MQSMVILLLLFTNKPLTTEVMIVCLQILKTKFVTLRSLLIGSTNLAILVIVPTTTDHNLKLLLTKCGELEITKFGTSIY